MAMVDIPITRLGQPPIMGNATSNLAFTTQNDAAAFLLRVPVSGSITAIRCRTGSVTVSKALDATLETVDTATGFPTGSTYGGSAAGQQATLTASTIYDVALATPADAVMGDLVAATFRCAVATPTFNLVAMAGGFYSPHCAQITGGAAWAKVNLVPIGGLVYGSSYYPSGAMGSVPNAIAIASNTDPDEVGIAWTQSVVCQRMRGAWLWADTDGDCEIRLYQDNTLLATAALDEDTRPTTNSFTHYVTFPARQILLPGLLYRLVMAGTVPSATATCYIYEHQEVSAAMLGLTNLGTGYVRTSRTDGGAWVALDTTKQALMGPIIDGIDIVGQSGWGGGP
jgi:hypothetical protein